MEVIFSYSLIMLYKSNKVKIVLCQNMQYVPSCPQQLALFSPVVSHQRTQSTSSPSLHLSPFHKTSNEINTENYTIDEYYLL